MDLLNRMNYRHTAHAMHSREEPLITGLLHNLPVIIDRMNILIHRINWR